MRTVAVVPARYAASRLPGKPLLAETGRALVLHVVDRVAQARTIDEILVATDDERIARVCAEAGVRAAMTSPACASGTDRVAEVAQRLSCDLVVNVQGDEPELPPGWIDALVQRMAHDDAPIGTVAVRSHDPAAFVAPHVVKVVCDPRGRALYFSRAPVPFDRERAGMPADGFLHHAGLYAYRPEVLAQLAALAPSRSERIERLEQLRALENGYPIVVVEVPGPAVGGIDTPEQYAGFVARTAAGRRARERDGHTPRGE
ncbi:MAG: 3-deoxy-manno-octulosonate cytidylyltransferase [Planctomycetota bacterium]|nr:MAG: 3-deoxy-manno-octulosonate cytidylyltransferase [Planctomycetota bacterium]